MSQVYVLLSGGVDSAVAALLLQRAGHQVTGVHLQLGEQCNPADATDARLVAEHLQVPFYVFDISEDYELKVAQPMVATYRAGQTPNPDVACNTEIKFGVVYEKLRRLGAEIVATGHYAQLDQARLMTAKDKSKDQTYFLWGVPRENLSHLAFPVGQYLKSEVRDLARQAGLPNADKKDSQGVCFLGQISIRTYLGNFIPERAGQIIDTAGRVLGQHSGAHLFTEGQRGGLDIKTGDGPYYVVKRDLSANTITVAHAEAIELLTTSVYLTNLNWLVDEPQEQLACLTRCRYRQPLVAANFNPVTQILTFSEPQSMIANGQSAVLYLDELVLGGGIIERL